MATTNIMATRREGKWCTSSRSSPGTQWWVGIDEEGLERWVDGEQGVAAMVSTMAAKYGRRQLQRSTW